jgi:hypothetical protein
LAFYSASSLTQQSASRHVTPRGRINPDSLLLLLNVSA